MSKQHDAKTSDELETILQGLWNDMSFAGKLNFLCRARDADKDHDKHAQPKKKGTFSFILYVTLIYDTYFQSFFPYTCISATNTWKVNKMFNNMNEDKMFYN